MLRRRRACGLQERLVLLALTGLFALLNPRAHAVITGTGAVKRFQNAPCVRLLHSTGDVGCRLMEPGGIELPLFGISDAAHITEFESHAMNPTVAVVIPPDFFNATILARLEATGRLGGVLLREGPLSDAAKQTNRAFSTAPRTPQGDSTPSASYDIDPSYEWNRHGSGLSMQSLKYPVALIQGDDADRIAELAEANRLNGVENYPRHAVQLAFYFGPSEVDSKGCLQWTDMDGKLEPQCLPIGGQSAWGVAGAPFGAKPLVLATAAMDGGSASMFRDVTSAANGAASGLAALLAAAEALGAAAEAGTVNVAALKKHIGFAAFQADAWSFMGSRRFVQDAVGAGIKCENRLSAEAAPAGLEACLDPIYPNMEFAKLNKADGGAGLASVLAIDQVGITAEPFRLYVHKAKGAPDADMHLVVGAGAGLPGGFAASAASASGALPPTPLTTFVREKAVASGFVLTGYNSAFANPAYQTHWDDNVDAAAVTAAATAAARAVYRLAGGDSRSASTISANATLVEALLVCLAGSSGSGSGGDGGCDLAKDYVNSELENIANYLGQGVSVPAPWPPAAYAGVLSPWDGGGLPVVDHPSANGGSSFLGKFSGCFDSAGGDRLRLIPSAREMFVRTFTSQQMNRAAGLGLAAAAQGGGEGSAACTSSADCGGAGSCGAVGAAAKMECVAGTCVCPLAHYHLAMDVGLKRTESYDTFEIVDENAPLWAEPNWGSIGVRGFIDPGRGIGGSALVMGLMVAMVAAIASQALYTSLKKEKLV